MGKYQLPPRFDLTVNEFKATRLRVVDNYKRGVMAEGRVSCKKGCSACCYYPVMVSILEALVIYRGLLKHRMWTSTLKAKFEESANKVRGLNLEVWFLSHIACPLLDEESKTCTAYKQRPFSCRTVFSRSDPALCDPATSGGHPPLLDRKQVVSEVGQEESRLMRKHQLGRIVLPLSVAVLLAEKLDKGEIDFAGCGLAVWKEYIHRW